MTILRFLFRISLSHPTSVIGGRGTKWPRWTSDRMRHRRKKEPSGDASNKAEPKSSEASPEVKEETKDDQIKQASKPKPTRLRACAWLCVKLIIFLVVLAVLAVLAILFVIFALPRIISEMEVATYYYVCIMHMY